MASRGPGDGYAGGCRRVQGPPEFLSVGTCAVLAPCLREARSCLVAAWCRGGCCPRGPAPGDLVLLLLALRVPYSPAVFLAAHHPSGECGPSPSWTPRWVGSRGAEISLGPNMDSDFGKRTSASAAPDPSASAAPLPPIPPASAQPNTPASATPLASARPHIPAPADTRPTLEGRVSDSMFRGGGELPASPTPRILILSCETKKLSSLSPFQRKEGCDRFGKVTRCDKLRDGGIEVEFLDEKDAKKALSATEFMYSVKDGQGRRLVKLPIAVSAHRTKNFSRGMIYCVDLEDVSDDEIADGLSDFGVVMARRIKSRNKRTGTLEPTHNIILTFNQMDLPREVTVGYVRVKVRTYFPSPMRCFRCLRFGHTRDHCRNRPTCSKCAATDHTGEACTEASRKCVNCDAPHSAFDKDCPAFLREKEIIAIKVTEASILQGGA